MGRGTFVDDWKIEGVRRHLQDRFEGRTIEHYPRGGTTHLFQVIERRRTLHHLVVTPRFFDRMTSPMSLVEALVAVDVGDRMRRGGEITVELY